MKLEFSERIFEKSSNIKFRQNPCNGSRFLSCEWTDRRTDMIKLIVAFRNFSNAPKNITVSLYVINWSVFVNETEGVYCAVGSGCLKQMTFCIWRVNYLYKQQDLLQKCTKQKYTEHNTHTNVLSTKYVSFFFTYFFRNNFCSDKYLVSYTRNA